MTNVTAVAGGRSMTDVTAMKGVTFMTGDTYLGMLIKVKSW